MKVFKLTTESHALLDLNEQSWETTIAYYEKETHKRAPYYCDLKKKTRYFAVCPGCNNPVQLVNLYVNKKLPDNEKKQSPHAKHQPHSVIGIATYYQEKYDTCELRQRTPFSDTEKRTGTDVPNEILQLIQRYPDILYKHIRKIIGINFSRRVFERMIDNFLRANGHCYKRINKFNLPYAFLYMQKSTRIINQHITEGHAYQKEIIDCIQNSKYFTVSDNKITPINPKVDGFVEIDFYLTKHKITPIKNMITLCITESKGGEVDSLLEKEFPVNESDYINDINEAMDNGDNEMDSNKARSQLREMVLNCIEKNN
ncbi:hypothetical protein COI51_12735 [Bacillus toyonensis]|uniref:hypothetical protein n=1 Tax=Bacillus toyonensis TaxID=155322 RepID=UPI000BEF4391|nr:hypothetical protein [Bacillus toyonensis]PEM15265.1 hypothetical protein CN616_23210 [Bacillus toyonensis]PGB24857.1 hypothetical protein COM06_19645 [Bacillus toyonensis]PGC34656.1 hypothetical protein COM10_20310 [Bacillus toyonensis]PHF84369.1 hypothetical protein COI51_12735 [Bacillus toyonensis]PHF99860.1 hypothetical protein COI49_23400 [Bacillus toyonensis]